MHIDQLDTLYKSFGSKNSSRVIWGHRGQKVIWGHRGQKVILTKNGTTSTNYMA